MEESKHVYLPLIEIGNGVEREICEFQARKVLFMKLGQPPSFFLGWDLEDQGSLGRGKGDESELGLRLSFAIAMGFIAQGLG